MGTNGTPDLADAIIATHSTSGVACGTIIHEGWNLCCICDDRMSAFSAIEILHDVGVKGKSPNVRVAVEKRVVSEGGSQVVDIDGRVGVWVC